MTRQRPYDETEAPVIQIRGGRPKSKHIENNLIKTKTKAVFCATKSMTKELATSIMSISRGIRELGDVLKN